MKSMIGYVATFPLLLAACTSPGKAPGATPTTDTTDRGPTKVVDLLDCTVDIRPRTREMQKEEGFRVEYDWPNRAAKDVLDLWITPIKQKSEVGVYTASGKLVSKIPTDKEVALKLTWNLDAHSVTIAGQKSESAYLYGQRVEDGPIHSPAFVEQQQGEMLRVRCFNEGLFTTLVLK